MREIRIFPLLFVELDGFFSENDEGLSISLTELPFDTAGGSETVLG